VVGVVAIELNPASREGVQVGRLRLGEALPGAAVPAGIRPPEVVGEREEDVRARRAHREHV
jgi:hypothetical protein